jgi:hypothetical protein
MRSRLSETETDTDTDREGGRDKRGREGGREGGRERSGALAAMAMADVGWPAVYRTVYRITEYAESGKAKRCERQRVGAVGSCTCMLVHAGLQGAVGGCSRSQHALGSLPARC